MMEVTLESKWTQIGQLRDYPQDVIKNEPQFFAASFDYVHANGGPIALEFLHIVDRYFLQYAPKCAPVFDSRVHMLMPGMYPCIPGWHVDDVPRTRADGQPDHINPRYRAQHIMANIGDASLTEMYDGQITLEEPRLGDGNTYQKWHKQLEGCRLYQPNRYFHTLPGQVWRFDWQGLHQGTAATKPGWRMFIRVSWDTERKRFDEIRKQTQVYMADPFKGW